MRSKPALKAVSFALCCLITLNSQTAIAHNAKVHEGMTKRAHQIMLIVSRLNAQGKTMGSPPPGVTAAQWKAFHADIAASMPKLDLLAKDPNKTIAKLADATSAPDYYTGDIHLFAKPSNMLGQSAGTKMADEAAKNGALVVLVPLVCGVSCLGELLGIGNSTCKTCIKKAKELSEDVPTPSDLANLIPGIGDIASKDYTGVWHFINLSDAATFSDHYDDHPGLFYERAGPFGVPGTVDVGILAITDGLGLSVNPEKSDGVSRYQIANANDSFPDGDKYNSTLFRSGSQWQKYAMGHTTFESLDNFALWGWREFQTGGSNDDRLGRLGYPLHALGDATVPMHVTNTTSWGHRPFEDAQARLWDGKISELLDDGTILATAYQYRQEILAWRAHGHPGDIPIRHLIRTVAKHTLDYSLQKQTETNSWPFEDSSSLLYSGSVSEDFSGPKEIAIGAYSNRSDAAALVKPLFEDGIAAELAVLMSAVETNGVARQEPASSGADLSFSPASWRAQPSPLTAVSNDPEPGKLRNETMQRRETPAQIQIADVVKTNYARLGRSLIIDEISPAEYLQRVWNQTSKAKLAARDIAWADELAGNDKDGDLVPDSRDRCPDTPSLAATDATGCPTRERLPNAPSRRAMQTFFSRINIMVSPKCPSAPAPRTPQLVKIGTSTGTRDLMFAVRPLGNQTANCVTFYEFGVRFKGVFEGNKNFLPADAYREVVFRNTDSKDPSPTAQNRLVFRIVRDPAPQDADRNFMLKAWGSYSNYDWRVRVVNANGLASEWSEWRKAGAISFNEP